MWRNYSPRKLFKVVPHYFVKITEYSTGSLVKLWKKRANWQDEPACLLNSVDATQLIFQWNSKKTTAAYQIPRLSVPHRIASHRTALRRASLWHVVAYNHVEMPKVSSSIVIDGAMIICKLWSPHNRKSEEYVLHVEANRVSWKIPMCKMLHSLCPLIQVSEFSQRIILWMILWDEHRHRNGSALQVIF